MKTSIALRISLLIGAFWVSVPVNAAPLLPEQKPLLTGVTGAKPNVMLNLDNSGSMSWPFLDSYPDKIANPYQIRSSSVNTMYYDPSKYYRARVNADGTPYVPTTADAADGCPLSKVALGNLPAGQAYDCNKGNRVGTDRSTSRANGNMTFIDNRGWSANYVSGATIGGIQGVSAIGGGSTSPIHLELTNPSGSQSFTYVNSCTFTNCTTPQVVTLFGNGSIKTGTALSTLTLGNGSGSASPSGGTTVTSVALPAGSNRPDCGTNATTCTFAQEMNNILNWYRYYHTRIKSVTTATGQALSDPIYDNAFRLGYTKFNVQSVSTADNNDNPIVGSADTGVSRGVRYFKNNGGTQNWKSDTFNWLYLMPAAGGTPTHNSVKNAGEYYKTSSPWKNDPTSSSAVDATNDLSCRRSFHIVLSDGAWNAGSSNLPAQDASKSGTTYTGNPPSTTGAGSTLAYSPNGASTRNLYIPYGDNKKSTNGLADLTAQYFWNTDFSTLPNNVPPIKKQNNPTFWQNMTTYTIGWGLTSSGDQGITGGLTQAQINQYRSQWLNGATTPTTPSWPTGDLNDSNATTDDQRVDDFIHAGYTGGGRSYSVYSASDVERALNSVLNSLGTGNDAGVALSSGTSSGTGSAYSLSGTLKYTTEYDTSNNEGDIKAFELNNAGNYKTLDANNNPVNKWSANARMPIASVRKLYSLSNYNPNTSANYTDKLLRKTISYNGTLSSQPADFQSLLNLNNKQKTDSTFINYLLGDEGSADINGVAYRSRTAKLGASVNSAPLYVGGALNMAYTTGTNGSTSTVDGNSTYSTYLNNKKTYPATIYSANNDGVVHVLNAAGNDTALSPILDGQEIAAYMPKGGMAKQVDLADAGYTFKYVLDGPLVEDDIYDNSGSSTAAAPSGGTNWRHVVFGTGGRADKFAFAFESPFSISGKNRIPGKDNFLWEVNSTISDYSDMGYISNGPTAGQLDDGTWVTLMNSGHYGANNKLGLYVINALNGKLIKFIQLPSTYSTGNRGLGGVVAVRDKSRKVVAAYAGDANGNLWRFDLRSTNMKLSYGKPLFSASAGQAIFAAPAWQPHPGDGGKTCPTGTQSQCGAIVVVGTGILLDSDDLKQPATQQTVYGIWDPTAIGGDDLTTFTTAQKSDLVIQTIDLVSATLDKSANTALANDKYYKVSKNTVDWSTKKGWQLNMGVITLPSIMTNSERVLADVVNLGSSVLLTSVTLQDRSSNIEACFTSNNNPNLIYVVDALTGGNKRSFDFNGDGNPDEYSIMFINDGGFTRGNITSTSDAIGKVNEGNITLTPKPDCTGASGIETGVGGSRRVYDGCPNTGWRRQWRPISKPPL
jgi:type IV pilus assembly protein PilY1